jgi:hypothetical protein
MPPSAAGASAFLGPQPASTRAAAIKRVFLIVTPQKGFNVQYQSARSTSPQPAGRTGGESIPPNGFVKPNPGVTTAAPNGDRLHSVLFRNEL